MSQRHLKSGFTLIELSIVLVIIGLIVGGVLVGQDLINAAAVRAQISQIEKLNTAVHTFRGKYDALPGDMSVSSAQQFGFNVGSGCVGTRGARDGNGLIEGDTTPFFYAQGYGETGLFWQDLSTAGLIEGTFPGGAHCDGLVSTVTAAGLNSFFPEAKIGRGNYLYIYEANSSNWYGLSGVTSIEAGGSLTSNTSITVDQAYRIDSKVDDGLPITGNVQALYLCCGDSTVLNVANGRDSDGGVDDSSTCFIADFNNLPGFPTHYSIAINNGSAPTCALSFRFQ